jgi:hypothetical protein
MNDNDYNILDVWLSGEGTVRVISGISDSDKHRLSINISGSIDTNSHPWAETFNKIDVTLYFSDEVPADGCATLSASGISREGDVVYRDSLNIKAFLPAASFTMVSRILTSSPAGRPMLFLLTDDDIAAWAAQNELALLKAQECAFDYGSRAEVVEQANEEVAELASEEVAEETDIGTTPRRRERFRIRTKKGPVGCVPVVLGVMIFVFVIFFVLAPIVVDVFEIKF